MDLDDYDRYLDSLGEKLKASSKKSRLEFEEDNLADLFDDLSSSVKKSKKRTHEKEEESVKELISEKRVKKKLKKSETKKTIVENVTEAVTDQAPLVAIKIKPKDENLIKKVKSILNKINESNFDSSLTEVEDVLRQYPRADVCDEFIRMVLSHLSGHVGLLESFVNVITALFYSIAGFAASNFVVQLSASLLSEFLSLSKELVLASSEEEDDQTGKQLYASNIITLLSYLYLYQMISASVLYDLIQRLSENLNESHASLLLKLLKTCGFRLRHDDPVFLKEMIKHIQEKATLVEKKSSRFKFMLEALDDLKSNKKRIIKSDLESYPRWKKRLVGIFAAKSIAKPEPLKMPLQEILDYKSTSRASRALKEIAHSKMGTSVSSTTKSQEVLSAAENQQMNTDVRKLIFTTLMASDDYLDAAEGLIRLKLKSKQQKEIPRVLVHCCCQEKSFNPFYFLVAKELCNIGKVFQLSLQYAFWDSFKYLETLGVQQLDHLARFLSLLISTSCLPLSSLKAAPFESMDTVQQTNLFLSILMSDLLIRLDKSKLALMLQKILFGFGSDREKQTSRKNRIDDLEEPGRSKELFDEVESNPGVRQLVKEGIHLVMRRLKGQIGLLNLSSDELSTLKSRITYVLDHLNTKG